MSDDTGKWRSGDAPLLVLSNIKVRSVSIRL